MIIRKATLKDLPTIISLWKEFIKYHNEVLVKRDKKLQPFLAKKKNAVNIIQKYLKDQIKSKNAEIYLAEIKGKPVGYSLIYIKKNIPIFKLERIGDISDLFVKKEFRGKGISNKLKDNAIKWFKKRGIKNMVVNVHCENKSAYSVFKRWGFFDYHLEMRKKI